MITIKLISDSKILRISGWLFLLIILVTISGCRKKNPWEVNVSGINIPPVEIKRYEKVLFSINPFNLREEIKPFMNEFSIFLGEEMDTIYGQHQLYDYITNPFNKGVYNDTQEIWADVSPVEKELSQAFRYYHYHFPEQPIPVVYSYVSGLDFDLPVKYYEGNLIIGLDMFLGSNYVNYERIGIPAFKRQRFIPEAVGVESMLALAHEILKTNYTIPENLLEHMIMEGKLLYFLDCMFPAKPDHLKISYTGEQLEWANRNQGPSWAYYIENELLYSTDRQMIQKFVGAAPFTAPFSTGSSPRMGVYNGWQIVRQYMRRNPDVSLKSLLLEKDAREILNKSNYRP